MKIVFIAEGIKEVKTTFTEKQLVNIELTAERFRQDMLAKHFEPFLTKIPHVINIQY